MHKPAMTRMPPLSMATWKILKILTAREREHRDSHPFGI
tara:strand:+ start:221 stop:337 length:117 start_codon:yes stop_codon:yes gene_type:complete